MSFVMDAIGIATSARREYRTAECVASQISTELERKLGPSVPDLADADEAGCGFAAADPGVLVSFGTLPTAMAGTNAAKTLPSARIRTLGFHIVRIAASPSAFKV
jgi:hypothetical protein